MLSNTPLDVHIIQNLYRKKDSSSKRSLHTTRSCNNIWRWDKKYSIQHQFDPKKLVFLNSRPAEDVVLFFFSCLIQGHKWWLSTEETPVGLWTFKIKLWGQFQAQQVHENANRPEAISTNAFNSCQRASACYMAGLLHKHIQNDCTDPNDWNVAAHDTLSVD